ncbi:THO complex subunit 4D-like [Tripterygium wilfordii]|uniref:THO complex subunit 4D-like n=1 Tax=Tripterygium wilfordii TaxID=458696 RepID=UPI0018F82A1F|nr:THO complex subunit 4D-like [Tripterygium wilfordii]
MSKTSFFTVRNCFEQSYAVIWNPAKRVKPPKPVMAHKPPSLVPIQFAPSYYATIYERLHEVSPILNSHSFLSSLCVLLSLGSSLSLCASLFLRRFTDCLRVYLLFVSLGLIVTSVDMSLDDIIKKNSERVRGRGRGGRGPSSSLGGERMTGPVRKGPLAVNALPSSYMIAKPARRTRSFPWQLNLFEDSLRAAGISGVEVGTKLYVSNLDSGVSNEDIRELFSQIGDLKRHAIHYDKNGRPGGSAEEVYARRSDAFAALKRYNNVLLDGKPMKLEVVGDNVEIPVSAHVNVTGVNGRRKRTVVTTYVILSYSVLFEFRFCKKLIRVKCHSINR